MQSRKLSLKLQGRFKKPNQSVRDPSSGDRCNTSKYMHQEFEAKLQRDILKMSKNKSFYFRARFGAIYGASKTKKCLLKNSTIGNRLLF